LQRPAVSLISHICSHFHLSAPVNDDEWIFHLRLLPGRTSYYSLETMKFI